MMHDRRRGRQVSHRSLAQRGFTLVEFSIVLVIVGCVTWAVSNAYGSVDALGSRDRAAQTAEGLKDALRAFALRNGRLPCPDATGSGWEGLSAGQCPTALDAGWLPYHSLQLEPPSAALHALYAVYRNAGATAGNADLAVTMERTGDLLGTPGYRDTRDFMRALLNAAAETPSTSQAHLTGNDGTEGPVDCVANARANPAFFLVLPLTDRSIGTGTTAGRFDPPHAYGAICAFSPGSAINIARDDVVAAESLASLTGWLGAHAP